MSYDIIHGGELAALTGHILGHMFDSCAWSRSLNSKLKFEDFPPGPLGIKAHVWEAAPTIVRGLAAIGDRRPVETVLTHDQLCDQLCSCQN